MRAFFSSRQGLVLPSIILTAPPSAARITRAKRRAAAVVDGKTKLCIARADSKEESLLPLREKDAKAWRGEAEPSRSWMRGRAPKGARARKSAPVALTRCAPSARPPCIWTESPLCAERGEVSGPMAIGPLARRAAPVPPQATTAGELWDRRRCHIRPNSRLNCNRMDKAGYRDRDH